MIRRALLALVCAAALGGLANSAGAQEPNLHYARTYNSTDWQRFYHYPYVYYPQNFWNADYYKSSDSLYYRYSPEMRIPVYNRQWHNEYPQSRRYHQGHQFVLDVF